MRIFLNSLTQQKCFPAISRLLRHGSAAAAAVAVTMVISGCGSSRPIKYYQLTYPTSAASQQAPLNISILVRTFEAAHLYQDERIVYSTNPNELGLYEENRWVAPPVELIQDALIRGLRSSGRYRSVMVVRGEGGGDFALAGHLYEFGEVDGAEVVARLNYTVRLRDRKSGMIVWTHTYNHDEPASAKTVTAVVAAMDKNVQRSVEEVQAGLNEYFHANPPKQ